MYMTLNCLHPQGTLRLSLPSWKNNMLVENSRSDGVIFLYTHWVCQHNLEQAVCTLENHCIMCPFSKCYVVGKPLSYLLEILHHLRSIDMGGIRVLELRVYEQADKHESALELLSALFKQCK